MSITAKLFIEGHKTEDQGIGIISCNFGFSQNLDKMGYIASRVKADLINISFRGSEDPEIVNWMLTNNIKKGYIEFSGFIDTEAKRKVHFNHAYLVEYSESFSDHSDIIINLSISAGEITIAGEQYGTNWRWEKGKK